jgi:Helix-turn-helix domain
MVAGFTAGDVGRALRRARTRQGLSIKDVSTRTGLPIAQLRAAETGSLDVPNQLSTLKTVRRYADFLGLPGDRFALALLEHWPTNAAPPRPPSAGESTAVVHRHLGPSVTASDGSPVVETPTARSGPVGPPTVTLPTVGRYESGAAASSEASITRLPAQRRTADGDGAGPQAIYAYQDTGVTPAVPAPDEGQVWRGPRRRPQATLRALVVVVALAVLAALAALVVDLVKPSVFRSVGAGHPTGSTVPVASPPTSGVTASTALKATPTTAAHKATTHEASTHGTSSHGKATKPTPTSPTTATMTVGSSPFVVKVAAVGGDVWAEVTSPVGATPVFAGIIDPGQSKSFTVTGSTAVEVGSSAARLSVSTKSKSLLSTYELPGAPYTVTLQPSAG